MSVIEQDYAERIDRLINGQVFPIRSLPHNHAIPGGVWVDGHEFVTRPLTCARCGVERRLKRARLDFEPYAPVGEDGWPEFAPVVRLAWCDDHGLEPVTGEKQYRTGYDRGVAGEFACGQIVKDDVF